MRSVLTSDQRSTHSGTCGAGARLVVLTIQSRSTWWGWGNMPVSVKYRPGISISLPFGVVIGFELPSTGPTHDTEMPYTDGRLLRVRRLAGEVNSALEIGELQRAADRLLVLADEFPAAERREAVLLSYRVGSLYRARETLSRARWSQQCEQLTAEMLDSVATYKAVADLASDARGQATTGLAGQDEYSTVTVREAMRRSDGDRCVVRCEDIGWCVGGNWILQGLSFELMSGSVVGIVGPNGAGKTSLLRIIAQELPVSRGRVSYPDLSWSDDLPMRHVYDRIAYVPQIPTRYHGELETNLRRFAALHGLRGEALDDELSYVMELLQLGEYRSAAWAALSGGYRTRIDLARAMLVSPDVVILDEPLGPLDLQAERDYLRHLRDLAESRRQVCVVITSQDVHAVSAIADYVIALRDGGIAFAGTPTEIARSLPQYACEFASELGAGALAEVVAHLPGAHLRNLGTSWLLTADSSVSARDVLGALLSDGGSVAYFRDLSSSPQQFLEERESDRLR